MDVAFRIIGDAILRPIGFKQLDPRSIQVDNRLNLTDKPTVNVIIIFDVHSMLHEDFISELHIQNRQNDYTILADTISRCVV